MTRVLAHGTSSRMGLQRTRNQDVVGCAPDVAVWLVADGMGGHAAGDIASALIRDAVIESVRAGLALRDAVAAANAALLDAAAERSDRAGMGTTIAALQAGPDEASVVWVGDSRVYRLRDGRLDCLTRDHSLVQSLVDGGNIRPEDARRHPRRNVLLSALGQSAPRIDRIPLALRRGDRLLLCSDGVHGVLDDDTIAGVLAEAAHAEAAAARLIEAVARLGGTDDASAVVLHS